MFYDEFLYWCEQKGVSPTKAASDCSFSTGLPTAWKKRGLSPRMEIQQKLAAYFGISIEELNDHTKSVPMYDKAVFELSKIYEKIAELAAKQGLTDNALSRKAGISTSLLNRIKNSDDDVSISAKTAEKIAKALGVEVSYLFSNKKEASEETSEATKELIKAILAMSEQEREALLLGLKLRNKD